MTQSVLAECAGVSLATVQSLEAGRGNPSQSTLGRILDELGLVRELRDRDTDWDALAALGLPLVQLRKRRVTRSEDSLVAHIIPALLEVRSRNCTRDRERKKEALQALLLALKTHFPSVYARRLGRSRLAGSFIPVDPSGRVVKLYRVAVASLAEYL